MEENSKDAGNIRSQQINAELDTVKQNIKKELPPLDPIRVHMRTEIGEEGGNTPTIITAIQNALLALGRHCPTENEIIKIIGKDYLSKDRGLATVNSETVTKVLTGIGSRVEMTPSNSAAQILEEVQKGASAVITVGVNQPATIYPGSRIIYNDKGELQVQVVDPLDGPKLESIRDIVRFQIPIVYPPPYKIATIIKNVAK